MAWQIIMTALTSGAVLGFVQYLIQRHDARKGTAKQILDKLAEHDRKFDKSERDSLRTQLLVLMTDYPDEQHEIFTVAQHYFTDLHGNWYMTTLFRAYLKEHGLESPVWFRAGNGGING